MGIEGHLIQELKRRFGQTPEFIVRAPGRVNLIGEHTDYNDGFVLPMAIDRSIWIVCRRRQDREVHCYTTAYNEYLTFSLDDLQNESHAWGEYLKGIAWILQEEGYILKGWEGVLYGDIPIGAGLSSSGAIQVATLRVFSVASDFPWDAIRMARLGQRCEVEWVGVDSGIMDQMISALGEADHVLLIDCRSLGTDAIPLPSESSIVVLDTGTRRDLVHSAYNQRRQECEAVTRYFNVPALRDLSLEELEGAQTHLGDKLFRRARHVINENLRTQKAVQAIRDKDMIALGELINRSHESLRDDFEVSTDELNGVVALARSNQECLGARLTGAGFGGCAIALVRREGSGFFLSKMEDQYLHAMGLKMQGYICEPSDGVRVVKI